jgi:ATP-dependent protease HslVU (ClpYQ) peptidase subunit
MTTIAARFSTKEICADKMVSGEDSFYLTSKLRKGKGRIYGACGDWDKCLKMLKAIQNKKNLDADIDVTVLELRNDGIWIYESTIIPVRIDNDFFAIGTGAGYAMAAMHLGKSPLEAVEIAALYDPSTRGPIELMTLGAHRASKR